VLFLKLMIKLAKHTRDSTGLSHKDNQTS